MSDADAGEWVLVFGFLAFSGAAVGALLTLVVVSIVGCP